MDDDATGRALAALAGWTVPLIQFNGMVAASLGVTDTGLQCLYALGTHGPATAGELARRVNLTTGAASRMIDRLHAAGYVRRVPDPADRRRVRVEPTADALDRVAAHYRPLTDRLAADLRVFDADGLAALVGFLHAAERSTEAEIGRLRSAPSSRERP
jgi:DNA-binding MarR family transcriptional regulator